jgi:hypothetical protein
VSEIVAGGHEGLTERRHAMIGPLTQSVLGLVAIILGIVGLAIAAQNATVPQYLGAVAAIALGVSLVFVGATLVVSYARMAAVARGTSAAEGPMVGTTVDLFLGGAIVILGILALLKIDAALLIAIQAIVVGVGLLMSSAAAIRLATIEIDASGDNPMARRIAEEIVFATSSVRIIAGIAVTILGIIAVTGVAPITLALVSAIVAGSALVLNSSTLSMRVAGMLSAH